MTKDQIKALIKADYERKIKAFEQVNRFNQTIIIGDSMVAYLNLSSYRLNDQVINQGIAGDTTEGVMYRLNLVKRLKPKSVILSIGSNDLVLLYHTPEAIVKNIISIKNQLESELKIKVYVFSMTPVLRDHIISNMDYIDSRTNVELEHINHLLKKHIKEEQFFNVYDDLLDENSHLNLRYTTDGIHLNKAGYEFYIKYIKSVL